MRGRESFLSGPLQRHGLHNDDTKTAGERHGLHDDDTKTAGVRHRLHNDDTTTAGERRRLHDDDTKTEGDEAQTAMQHTKTAVVLGEAAVVASAPLRLDKDTRITGLWEEEEPPRTASPAQ